MKLTPVLSSSIAAIRWTLNAPPMYFESNEKMEEIRKEACHPLLRDLDPNDWSQRVLTALVLLGNGYTDEAHNLVVPLSWPQDTPYGLGPVVYEHVEPTTRRLASYTHALVHRHEGGHIGEFGMVGWMNANYWSSATHKADGDLPNRELALHVGALVHDRPELDEDMKADLRDEEFFESRAVHEICRTIGGKLAERLAETELRVLLAFALQRAGYECTTEEILALRK